MLFLIIAFFINEIVFSEKCSDSYYTRCQLTGFRKCKHGYHRNEYHVKWTCVPFFYSTRCDISWECPEDKFCGDPPNECNDHPECMDDTSDILNWDVDKIDWHIDNAVVTRHFDDVTLPVETQSQDETNSKIEEMQIAAKWHEVESSTWTNVNGVYISDYFNWTSAVPVYLGANRFGLSKPYDHYWSQTDQSSSKTSTFRCMGNDPDTDISCTVTAKRVEFNVTFQMHVKRVNQNFACMSSGLWQGIGYYDLEAHVFEHFQDDTSTGLNSVPWPILAAIGAAVGVCFVLLFIHCVSRKQVEIEPVALLSPIASDVPNFTNRNNVFDAGPSGPMNTNLLCLTSDV